MARNTMNYSFEHCNRAFSFGKAPTVKFRSKTVKVLAENEPLQRAFTWSVNDFITKYSFKEARQLLWDMNFDKEKTLNKLGYTLDSEKTDFTLLTDKLATSLYGELRFQYHEFHKDFLEISTLLSEHQITACEKEIYALKNALKNDSLLLYTAIFICKKNAGLDDAILNVYMPSLYSQRENEVLKGISNIGFSRISAPFFAQYGNLIADFIKALHTCMTQKEEESTNAEEDKALDSVSVVSVDENPSPIQDSKNDVVDENETSVQTQSQFIPIDTLIKNKEAVLAFIKYYNELKALDKSLFELYTICCLELDELGINHIQVMKRPRAIEAVLKNIKD